MMRLVLRLTAKPVLRYGSYRVLRHGMGIADRVIGRIARRELRGSGAFAHRQTGHGLYLAPEGSAPARTILYIPGGAFIARAPNAHRLLVQRVCRAAGAHALIADYRLAPEHPFPCALDDVLAAYRALLDSGIDPARIAIMGDSAGGGLCLSLALRLRELQLPQPAALVLLSPLTDLSFSGPSRRHNRWRDPLLPANRREADARLYLNGQDARNPLASPLFGDLRGLPPILAHVGSDEILLDDTLRLQQRAHAAGVRFRADVWPGMPHVWQLFPQLPESHGAIGEIARFVRQELPL